MKVSEKIRKRVQSRKALELFSFEEVYNPNESHAAIAKEMSRMCADGVVKRLIQGVYYKPSVSRFGEMKPTENDILRYLLFENGKQTGYISGDRLYNRLGLTTQVSGVITIATNQSDKRSGNFAHVRIRYVKAYAPIKKDNIPLLQLLDALKDVSIISDSSINDNLSLLYKLILDLTAAEKEKLVELALKYPPRVRALVGAMFSKIWKSNSECELRLNRLKSSIVNSSKFKYPNRDQILLEPKKWNIDEITSAR